MPYWGRAHHTPDPGRRALLRNQPCIHGRKRGSPVLWLLELSHRGEAGPDAEDFAIQAGSEQLGERKVVSGQDEG